MAFLKWLPFKRDSIDVESGTLYDSVRIAIKDVQNFAKSHGGRIELVSVTDDGEVQVRFHGACVGCPMSDQTLKEGIEERIRSEVPDVKTVTVLN